MGMWNLFPWRARAGGLPNPCPRIYPPGRIEKGHGWSTIHALFGTATRFFVRPPAYVVAVACSSCTCRCSASRVRSESFAAVSAARS
jgi:hypothetical protein